MTFFTVYLHMIVTIAAPITSINVCSVSVNMTARRPPINSKFVIKTFSPEFVKNLETM